MKNKLIVFFIALSVLCAYKVSYAQFDPYIIKGVDIKTYYSANAAYAEKTTTVAATTFLPGSYRIVGFTVISNTVGIPTAVWASLHDTLTTATTTNMFGEIQGSSSLENTFWYPYPKIISTGLTIKQSSYSSVIVYYIVE